MSLLSDVQSCLKWYGPYNTECNYTVSAAIVSFAESTSRTRVDDALLVQAAAAFLIGFQQYVQDDGTGDLQAQRRQMANILSQVAYADPVSADVYVAQLLSSEFDEVTLDWLMQAALNAVPYDPVALNVSNIARALYAIAVSPSYPTTVQQWAQSVSSQLQPYFAAAAGSSPLVPPAPSPAPAPVPARPTSSKTSPSVGQKVLIGLAIAAAGAAGLVYAFKTEV